MKARLWNACKRCAFETADPTEAQCPACGAALARVRRASPRAAPSLAERAFLLVLRQLSRDVPTPARDYRFDEGRRWRADFAWVAERVLVEIEGGTYSGGRHVRAQGYASDVEKYNAAALAGWLVLRFTSEMLIDNPHAVVGQVMLALARGQERMKR